MPESTTGHPWCCCGGCPGGDCLFGDTVEDGCCHACDHLLLWCERPALSRLNHMVFGNWQGTGQLCETCYTETIPGYQPVQAIYKFNRVVHRCVFAALDEAVNLIEMPPACPACPGPADTDCCSTQFPDGTCLCNKFWAGLGGINTNRKYKLLASDATKWFIEMSCHKGGFALGGVPPINDLYGEFLCLVFRERWWKIAQDCPPIDHIYVPGCNQVGGAGDCGGIPFNTSQLVPKWWIFACSGIPIYRFEITDAVRHGVITSGEAATFLSDCALHKTPPQGTLTKLAAAGIISAGDWRDEQRQAYIDLDALHPSAGYGACIQNVAAMHTLGPFRKRCTNPSVSLAATALLKKGDVIPEISALQADCFIAYPGGASDQSAYDHWAARQWVYFRGIQGGWVWANWAPEASGECIGLGLSEEEALLRGCGRNDSGCIGALRGEPRGPTTCVTCNNQTQPNTHPCDGCTIGCDECGGFPVQACAPDNLPIPTTCTNLGISPLCQGIQFRYSEYAFKNNLTDLDMYCYKNIKSILVEMKRSSDSWDYAIPFECRAESPALGTFKNFPAISGNHLGHSTICNPLSSGDFSTYTSADLCCGGICYSEPCWEINGLKKDCLAHTECPPHSTVGQIACMGGAVPCTP